MSRMNIKKPDDGLLLIEEGKTVDFTSPFYKKNSSESVRLPLASLLRFPPHKIFMALHKLVGEEVKEGDVIAEHKGMFGIKTYISEYNGVITEINHNDGSITMQVKSEEQDTVYCFFTGEVEEINADFVVLTVKTPKEVSIEPLDSYLGGKTFFYNDDTKTKITIDDVSDAVIIAEEIPSYDQIKIEALGAKAFITLHSLKDKTAIPNTKFSTLDDYEAACKTNAAYAVRGISSNSLFLYN